MTTMIRWLALLSLICGCGKSLREQLMEQGYSNIVPKDGLVCGGEDHVEEGYYAERNGHAWTVAKCCHTTMMLQTHFCGKVLCTHLTPVTHCSTSTVDLGVLPAEQDNIPWPR